MAAKGQKGRGVASRKAGKKTRQKAAAARPRGTNPVRSGSASSSRAIAGPRLEKRLVAVLEQLDASLSQHVLVALLQAKPQLAGKVEELIDVVLAERTADSVAEELVMELGAVEPSEVGARSGKRPWGYVEVGQAMVEVFEEILDPYVEQVRILGDLGFEDAAVEVCQGILLGLYAADQEAISDWLEWEPDLCSEATSQPLLALARTARKPGRRAQALSQSMTTFCRERLPDWPWLLDSCTFG